MAYTRSTGCTEVKHLLTRGDIDIIQAAQNTCSQLAAKGVPDAVFNLGPLYGAGYRYTLFAIHRLARDKIFGDQEMFLALGDENAWVPVRFKDDIGATFCPTTSSTSPAARPPTATGCAMASTTTSPPTYASASYTSTCQIYC